MRPLILSLGCICAAMAVACSSDSSDSNASSTTAATRAPEATATQRPAPPSPTAAPTQAPTAEPTAAPAPTSPPQTGGGGGGGASSTTVVVAQALEFVNKSVTARAGNFTLVLQNKDLLVPHDIRVDGFPGSASCTGVCETSTTFSAGPGSYRFSCTVHPEMVGTLTLVP